jgi:hypothetical protein
MSKRRYQVPLRTEVEIISESSNYNGKIGTLGAKYPGNLKAHNVYFSDAEYDFDTFMDYEIVPVRNIITIDNLEYETLCKVFDHDYIYETDRIIVKQKKFSHEEIESALEKYTSLLAKIFSRDADFGEEGIRLDSRGKVLELLNLMADDDYEKYDNTATAIEEAIMYEQWWTEGFRKHITWNGKGKKLPRYFNPEAKIETIFI